MWNVRYIGNRTHKCDIKTLMYWHFTSAWNVLFYVILFQSRSHGKEIPNPTHCDPVVERVIDDRSTREKVSTCLFVSFKSTVIHCVKNVCLFIGQNSLYIPVRKSGHYVYYYYRYSRTIDWISILLFALSRVSCAYKHKTLIEFVRTE